VIPVLHSDDRSVSSLDVSLRPITQQLLPDGYPPTELWGYGDPTKPNSFHYPAGTIEVTQRAKTRITWRNELVRNPELCFNPSNRKNKNRKEACRFVPHVIQDAHNTPLIDQSLHWANANRKCQSGERRTDCKGTSNEPYYGPVPMVPHVHGSRTEDGSDGFPEGWFLPKSSFVDDNDDGEYATEGSYFRSRRNSNQEDMEDGANVEENDSSTNEARGEGYAVYEYTNDQASTSLWYHDHALGITRLNVYAAGAGFYMIRPRSDGKGETFLGDLDVNGNPSKLPGPPLRAGEDPNTRNDDDGSRRRAREIGLIMSDASFYNDGRLFFPADRLYMEHPRCSDGTVFGGSSSSSMFAGSDVSPVWNPEVFHDTMLVNGNTWPNFNVAPERYRFRLLNSCDSRVLNLALKVQSSPPNNNSNNSNNNEKQEELPMYIIGSDQGLLPHVVKITTGFATVLIPGQHPPQQPHPQQHHQQALLITPAERYDVIIDFGNLPHNTQIIMTNTAPDDPFQGFDDNDNGEYEMADPQTTGMVMQFTVDHSLRRTDGEGDDTTSPYDLILEGHDELGPEVKVRDLALKEQPSAMCVSSQDPSSSCHQIQTIQCPISEIDPITLENHLSYGLTASLLGSHQPPNTRGVQHVQLHSWGDALDKHNQPRLHTIEIWEIYNYTPDAHPIHVHSVVFEILGRSNINVTPTGTSTEGGGGTQIIPPPPWEHGLKDTVIAYPYQITRIKMRFDVKGLFVWHCHILSHEDNEMMLKFCVLDDNDNGNGSGCPEELFVKKMSHAGNSAGVGQNVGI